MATAALPSPVEGLVAALTETFALITAGYALGKNGLLPRGSTKSFNAFLSWIALPAVYFHAMATLDVDGLNGGILLTLIVSKAIMMLIAATITIMFSSKEDQFIKKLGIFAVFCSSPNDVAVGLCIAQVLYPEYQVYLFFPIQGLIFNPIGFVMLEYGKAREAAALGDPAGTQRSLGSVLRAVTRRVVTNPLVLVNVCGLAYNAAFGPRLPLVATRPLRAAASTFTGVASFNIGLSMVGKGRYIKGRGVAWPVVLGALKVIFSGVVTYKVAAWLLPLDDRFQEFAFMYGALPVAVSPFVFSEEYNAATVVVAGALVVSMFLSAPVMFVMIAFSDSKCTTTDFCPLIGSIASYLNAASLLGGLWLMFLRLKVESFQVGPLSFLAPLGFSVVGYTTAQSGCLHLGRLCYDGTAASSCDGPTQQLWASVSVLRLFFQLQVYTWPLVLLLAMVLWIRRGAAAAAGWHAALHAFGWGYPAAAALAVAGLGVSHRLGCILVHGAAATAVTLTAYALLLAASTAALFFSNASHRKGPAPLGRSDSPQEFSGPDGQPASPFTDNTTLISHSSSLPTSSSDIHSFYSLWLREDGGAFEDSLLVSDGVRMHDKFRIMMLGTFSIFGLLAGGLRLVEALLDWEAEQGPFYQPGGIRRMFMLLAVCCTSGFGAFAALTFSFQVRAVRYYRDVGRRAYRLYRRLVYGPEAKWITYYEEPDPGRVQVAIGAENVPRLLEQLRKGSVLRPTRAGLRSFPNAARGCNIVTWLVDSQWAPDRAEAAVLGQQLLRNGHLYHVALQHDFLDAKYLYQVRAAPGPDPPPPPPDRDPERGD